MAWFAVHEIEYFKYRQGEQNVFPVWENIYLIEAKNVARDKAKKLVKEREVDDETLTLNNRPAKKYFRRNQKVGRGFTLE